MAAAAAVLYDSYGFSSLIGMPSKLTDALAVVPSLTEPSPPSGLAYFGVFEGIAEDDVARYLAERLHGAVTEKVGREMTAKQPCLIFVSPEAVESWWRTSLVDAFQAMDQEVLKGGAAEEIDIDLVEAVGGMALVALVLERHFGLANCGVSRAVICRGYEANNPDEKQRMENAGGFVDSDGLLEGLLLVSRGFGSNMCKPYLTAEPEVLMVPRDEQRDEFLILATDGLWECVTPAEACGFIKRKLREKEEGEPGWGSTTMLARELAEHAIREGSRHNVSVVLIMLKNLWGPRRKRVPSLKYGPDGWITGSGRMAVPKKFKL